MTDGWQKIKPQWARHADGYEVYGNGRDEVAYEDERGKATVAVERLVTGLVLDPDEVFWERPDGSRKRVGKADRAVIVERSAEGFRFLGSSVVVEAG